MKDPRILKVVVKPNTGLEVHYEGERDRKGTKARVSELVCAEPNENFTKAMKTLNAAMIKSTAAGHFEHALDQAALADVLDAKQLAEVKKKCLQYIAKSFAITQVRIKYDSADVASVKVFGTFTNHVNDPIVVHTPAIELTGEPVYGWESTMLKNIHKLIDSVREFLSGKYTQIAMEEEPEEEIEELEELEDEAEEEVVAEDGGESEEDEETSKEKASKTRLRVHRKAA